MERYNNYIPLHTYLSKYPDTTDSLFSDFFVQQDSCRTSDAKQPQALSKEWRWKTSWKSAAGGRWTMVETGPWGFL